MSATAISAPQSVVLLRYDDHAGTVCVEVTECDRIILATAEAARACGAYEEQQRFQAQFQDLMAHLCRWSQEQSADVESAYITVRDGGLLFLVVRREAEYDRGFEDALTDLDAEIARDEDFNLIRLSVLALPHCPPESLESFLGDNNVTLGFQVDGE